MYPFARMAWQLWRFRDAPPLRLDQPHVSRHRIWPWDLDPWAELNNGRTLTLYDLGRLPMARRMGLERVLRAEGWYITVAGASVRYRRRVTVFRRATMVSRVAGWDARFFYIDQSLWVDGACTSQVLIRNAVAHGGGIVPPTQVLAALGQAADSPALPDWIAAWIAAEALRPWPPLR